MKLTKIEIERAEPKAARYILWCDELGGFGVRIEPSGGKTFVVRYRAEGGGRSAPRRQVTIGRYDPLTLGQARDKAKKLLAGVALGQDPAGDLAAKRREMKVSALIDLYEAEGCIVQRGLRQGEPMKPTTRAYTVARLRHHVVPLLGSRRVSEITEGDIERFVRDVTAGKTAKDEKSETKRGRVHFAVEAVEDHFAFSEDLGHPRPLNVGRHLAPREVTELRLGRRLGLPFGAVELPVAVLVLRRSIASRDGGAGDRVKSVRHVLDSGGFRSSVALEIGGGVENEA